MCGLAGIVGAAAITQASRLERACDLMRHRGPDDAGVHFGDHIALGFRRLSIIDPSAAGHQPMISADGQLALVFNGEIYNFQELRRTLEPRHTFRSHTDTEVILHGFTEWGWEGLLRRIDGMFAFAIWDARARTLFAARDRVGKKPLYFSRQPNGLYFASTLNALLALLPLTPDINPVALDAFLTYQAVPAPLTIFDGVDHLSPAHSLVYQADSYSATIRRYWDVSFASKTSESETQITDRTEALVRAAVRRRLISDVPLGAFLSGGVDSSLVVAMMAQESHAEVEAVVIGYDEPAFDERPYARSVAERCSVRLHEHVVGPDVLSALPEIVWQYGQPVADISIVPTYAVAQFARHHVTVVLNGDGGDEAFGGYARPVVARAAERYRRVPLFARRALAAVLSRSEHGPLRKAWLLATAGAVAAPDAFVYERGFRAYRAEAYGPVLQPTLAGVVPDALYRSAWEHADGVDDVDRVLYGELTTYLPDQLLVKMDVSTMAHGLEARSPLLDTALIEYAATIPTSVRLKGMVTKHVLKRVAERYVPIEVIRRQKRGFTAPVSAWMRREFASLLRVTLESTSFRGRGWIRPQFVRRILGEHMAGTRDWSEQLWSLLVLEIWARQALDRTLSRHDTSDALREDHAASAAPRPLRTSGVRTNAAPIRSLQIGMGWFGEEPGGLNRFYQDLTSALPSVGVDVRGIVMGSGQVIVNSGGRIEAVTNPHGAILERVRGLRRAVREFLDQSQSPLLASHFSLYTYPTLDLLRGRPLVVHFQGPWALESRLENDSWLSVRAKYQIERAVYRRASRCIVLSNAFADVLSEQYGVSRDVIRVIPGAVEIRRFAIATTRDEARRQLALPTDRPIVLTVRRLVHRMGLENLIDATAEISRRVPDALVLIAGKGPLSTSLQERIRQSGLERHVRLLGFVPDDQLPCLYRAADVSVVPTTALEGFGLIVVESLAAGTPVLVTPISSLPEVVDGLSRELVLRDATAAAIADGVVAVLTGTIQLPSAARCLDFARERYSWPVVAARIRAIYEEALA